MAEARYYWLRLQEDFFKSLRIKKLRKLAGGDTFTIIYLKMQLMTLKTGGVLHYKGIEPTFAEELALDMDESPDNVDITIRYLLSCGLLETSDEREYFVPYSVANTGSEGSSAKRMRDARAKSVTLCEQSSEVCALSYGEKEKEKEKEIEIEIESKAQAPAPAPDKPTKHKYGEHNNVLLTSDEYDRLVQDLGKEEAERCIAYVDESAQITSNKNKWKDWNLVVRKCHREKWGLPREPVKKERGTNGVAERGTEKDMSGAFGTWL